MNAPEGKAPFGPPAANGKLPHATSSFIKEALDKGAEQFRWKERAALPKRERNHGARRGRFGELLIRAAPSASTGCSLLSPMASCIFNRASAIWAPNRCMMSTA